MKKTIKKLFLVMVMAVLCSIMAMTASAEEYGDFYYRILEDDTIEISSYGGSDASVVVPEEIEGKIVSRIGDSAFADCMTLEYVKLPKELKFIGNEAFFFCFSLKTIELSEENEYFSLDESGILYNKDKSKLICYPAAQKRKTFTIPDTVTTIGNSAFCGNVTLEEIILSDSVTEIEDNAFELCISLKNLVFSPNTKNIYADYENPMFSLKTLTIPEGVETIKEKYLANNVSLTDIYVESMDVEIIEESDYEDMLGAVFAEENMVAYDEFIHTLIWEQDINLSHLLMDEDLYNEWMSYFDGEYITDSTNIHCHPGSTAQIYAEAKSERVNYIPTHFFKGEWTYDYEQIVRWRKCIHCDELEIEPLEKTENGGTEIIAPENPDLDFEVDNVVEGDDNYILVQNALSESEYTLLKAFDITLKNKDGVHVQPDGTVKVKLPFDWEKEGNYKVYRVNDDGTLTDMNAYRQGSHMVFDTDHFSIYIIVEEKTGDTPEGPEAPTEPSTPDEPGKSPFDFLNEIIDWFKKLIDMITEFFRSIGDRT